MNSGNLGETTADSQPDPGQSLAVMAESLYLINLLVLPGLAFAALVWLWFKHKDSSSPLARQHLKQATYVSVVGGVLIVCLSTALIALGGFNKPWTWVVVITYFVCIHGALVLFGMLGLAKAMSGQAWRYPIIGPRSDV
ncbi:MAG: hypothetical protein ACM3VZ_01435 [Acidobacteriota bacterium]